MGILALVSHETKNNKKSGNQEKEIDLSSSSIVSLGDGGRGGREWLSHLSGGLYWRDFGQIGIFGGNWHFR